jgi:hypothetical protein
MIAPVLQPSSAPVAVTQVPASGQSANQAALLSIVEYLGKNVVFNSEAQRAEFARTLNSLR